VDVHDLYAASADYLHIVAVTGQALAEGLHTIAFKITSKNVAGAYSLAISGISLVRTA
jgi:glyoxylate carboligase